LFPFRAFQVSLSVHLPKLTAQLRLGDAPRASHQELQERMKAEQNEAQFKTNQAAVKSAFNYQDLTGKNIKRLEEIKIQASGAQGQLQAIGATNQFAGFQGDQLISINSQLAILTQLLTSQAQYEEQQRKLEQETALKSRNTSRFKEIGAVKGWRP